MELMKIAETASSTTYTLRASAQPALRPNPALLDSRYARAVPLLRNYRGKKEKSKIQDEKCPTA